MRLRRRLTESAPQISKNPSTVLLRRAIPVTKKRTTVSSRSNARVPQRSRTRSSSLGRSRVKRTFPDLSSEATCKERQARAKLSLKEASITDYWQQLFVKARWYGSASRKTASSHYQPFFRLSAIKRPGRRRAIRRLQYFQLSLHESTLVARPFGRDIQPVSVPKCRHPCRLVCLVPIRRHNCPLPLPRHDREANRWMGRSRPRNSLGDI
jgi:hypothetical protein